MILRGDDARSFFLDVSEPEIKSSPMPTVHVALVRGQVSHLNITGRVILKC